MDTLGNLLRLAGFAIGLVGLWLSASGMRVVVSGRIDERRQSANSLKRGLPLLAAGAALVVIGTLVLG